MPEERSDPLPGHPLPQRDPTRGGKPIQANSDAFFELKRWLDNGANRDGIAPPAVANRASVRCSDGFRRRASGSPVDTDQPGLPGLQGHVEPMLRVVVRLRQLPQLAAGRHVPDLRQQRRSGADRVQLRAVAGFVVARPPNAIDQSEILLRPLAPRPAA